MTVEISDTTASDARRAHRRLARSLLWRDVMRWRARIFDWAREDAAAAAIWTPVFIGLGVGAYFGLKSEPAFTTGLAMLAASAAAVALAPRYRSIFIAVMLAALGFVAADLRASRVATPILEREIGIRAIEGRIYAVERSSERERFVIDVQSIARLEPEDTPRRIRVTWRGERSDVVAGDLVTLRAGLSPPPPPAAPGSFDFARQLYFQSIGAVGFAVTSPAAIAARDANSLRTRIENARSGLTRRITEAAPGQGGAIVAAVVTGKREAISENSRAALRDAGLAHLLAISGLHMGLATGLVFFAVRGALAAIEPLAIRFPIKKWAAAAALLSGFAYLLLSGGAWSPRRAFVMTAIFLLAILFDRRAFSLRNVAIAASLILLTTPEALVHPGFQMSFAAATALIAIFEWWNRVADPGRDFSLGARLKRYAVGLAVTDLVASLATAPFALFHFNRVAIFSLPANILSMPLMAFWIMPAAVIGLLLTPIGLDGPAWVVAAKGVDILLAIGGEVSSWPGAVSLTPQWPTAALIAIAGGGLWFCLARSPLRLLGLAGVPAVAIIVAVAPRPDLFVSASGGNVGIVEAIPGEFRITPYNNRRDKFAVRVWNEIIGADPSTDDKSDTGFGDCGTDGCVARVRGRTVAVIGQSSVLAEDCARADLVVALYPVRGGDWRACEAVLIDKRSVWRRGAHAVRFTEESIVVETVGAARGARPWSGLASGR